MNRIVTAVRDLRKRIGELSQREMSDRLGMSLRALISYENGERTPTAAVLIQFMIAADSKNLTDLAIIFQRAAEQDIGHPIMRVRPSTTLELTDDEMEDGAALVCILRFQGSMYKQLRARWNELAEPVKAANRAKDFRASAIAGIMRMIQEGLAAGLTDEQIMANAPKVKQEILQGMLTTARGMQKLEVKRKGEQQ